MEKTNEGFLAWTDDELTALLAQEPALDLAWQAADPEGYAALALFQGPTQPREHGKQ